MPAQNSYVYRIIARLAFLSVRATPPYEAQTTRELYAWLLRAQKESADKFQPPADEKVLLQVLESLEGLGIVQSVKPLEESDDPGPAWRLSPCISPNLEHALTNGGNSFDTTPPGTPPGGGEGEPGGGRGMSEVLSHPILFSLSRDRWSDTIAAALPPDEHDLGSRRPR